MIDPEDADQETTAEDPSGRRRFLVEGAGLLALGALALGPGSGRAGGSDVVAALRRRWHAVARADRRPRWAKGVTARRAGDEVVVSIPGADPGLSLNETAAAIFLACDGRRTVADLAGILCRRYRVAPRLARADAARVVDALTRAGCLEAAG